MGNRPIAMGVSRIAYGAPGDGIPGASLTDLPNPTKSSVAFNFQDPKEVKIETEGSDVPLYVVLVKDSTDYIEFSIPTPPNAVLLAMAGGTIDTDKDKWNEPIGTPDISLTIVIDTPVRNGQYVEYTIVNGKVVTKISQAPGAEQAELLLVRVYKQAAITSDGKQNTAFSREVIDPSKKAKASASSDVKASSDSNTDSGTQTKSDSGTNKESSNNSNSGSSGGALKP
jgi:hypothetical protein